MAIADCCCNLSVWSVNQLLAQPCNFGRASPACWNFLLSHHILELWADLGSREWKLSSGNACWGADEPCGRKQDTRAAIELYFKNIFEALVLTQEKQLKLNLSKSEELCWFL